MDTSNQPLHHSCMQGSGIILVGIFKMTLGNQNSILQSSISEITQTQPTSNSVKVI